MKKPTFASAYVAFFPVLSELAQKHGYALAIHGSVSRDFDLVAVPWVEEASKPIELIREIAGLFHAQMDIPSGNGESLIVPEEKPHGRLSWIIPIGAGSCIDLSVLPMKSHEDK